MKIRVLLQSARGPFLLLTLVCIFLGGSTAVFQGIPLDISLFSLALIGGLFAHISVNTLNEYYDFRSGLDLHTIKTGFSGGSGALPENPGMAGAVLVLGILSLVVTCMIGFFLVAQSGLKIIPLGILGILIIIVYTGWLTRHPVLCLVAPGTGFGLLMVMGTQLVLTNEYSALSFYVGLVPFFLVNNLLLLNQYPDRQADKAVGRNHFIIQYGINAGNMAYAFFALAVAVVILVGVLSGYLPMLALTALLPMPLAVYSLRGAIKYGEKLGPHPRYLAANVVVALVTPLLLGMALILD
jgi:1,4-dihydroxy-2-naphthoate octaprenyltransferase